MPINPTVALAVLGHTPNELLAQQTYLSFSLRSQELGFFGCQSYFAHESDEEKEHLEKMLEYLNDFGQQYTVPPSPAIEPRTFDDVFSMFSAALEMEQEVTRRLSTIANLALANGDFLTLSWLQSFLLIQVESEIKYRDILARHEMSGENMPAFDDWVKGL